MPNEDLNRLSTPRGEYQINHWDIILGLAFFAVLAFDSVDTNAGMTEPYSPVSPLEPAGIEEIAPAAVTSHYLNEREY